MKHLRRRSVHFPEAIPRWPFLALLILFTSCAGHRVLQEPPAFTDNTPPMSAGFYTVHSVIDGLPSETIGSPFLGNVVYLYKAEFVADGKYYSGIKGSFLPHHYITTSLVHSRNAYSWQDGHDEDIQGEIQFSSISQNRVVAAVTTDRNTVEQVELRFYGPHMAPDSMKVIPIAHRGLCYQPPNNYDGIFPANTIPSFEAALASGYRGFEFDIRITRDKRFVVSHDEDLSAATTSHGFVKDKSLFELTNTLVLKSAFVPENKATASEAFIAAPMKPLKDVLDLFLDDPRLQTMVIDVKPDSDENIRTAAKPDLGGLTADQQRKILFLVRTEGAARVFKDLCPYSDIGLEGSIGPEPVEDIERFYPEAAGLPRGSHNTISFGANIVLAAKSIETSLEMIGKAMELASQYRYKILLWTFAKEWRLDFLREHEFFPDFLLLDIPYYQYALQEMKYVNQKELAIEGKRSVDTAIVNPLYKRMYNTYVADFWYQSGTLLEVTYGQANPAHNGVTGGFAPVGTVEFKLGRSELDKFSPTNASLNEWYIFFSASNSTAVLTVGGETDITSSWRRFGLGRTEGLGYYGSDVTFLPYVSQSLLLANVDEFGGGQGSPQGQIPASDQEVLARYPGAHRLGDRALYGFKAEIVKSFQLTASYETGMVFPRTEFLPWVGSFLLAQVGYRAMDYGLGKFVDDYPVFGPIISMAVRSGYLYCYYLLRRSAMSWPFGGEEPLRYEGLNVGVSVSF